jgi:peptide-methionine (S)-S-oxide reductase
MQATFAAGCFWGVEAYFANLPGVITTQVGFTGGTLPNPSYEQVCTGRTGHAEAILLEYNPEEISYEELLDHFWKMHNPTSLNRQGPDIGTQYRSAIFYHSEEQKNLADNSKAMLEKTRKFNYPIVTEISKAIAFYPAEEYHQKYWLKHPGYSCHLPSNHK